MHTNVGSTLQNPVALTFVSVNACLSPAIEYMCTGVDSSKSNYNTHPKLCTLHALYAPGLPDVYL